MSAPRISVVAAIARNRVIGCGNRMPWHIPEDLKRFKRLTAGRPVIMGRRTFESIIATLGTPLPERRNIVLTRSREWNRAGCVIVHLLAAALAAAEGSPEVFVIGGAEIYALALPEAERLYLTEIDREFEGDALFPEFDRTRWREVSREPRLAPGGGFGYAFVEYRRDG